METEIDKIKEYGQESNRINLNKLPFAEELINNLESEKIDYTQLNKNKEEK